MNKLNLKPGDKVLVVIPANLRRGQSLEARTRQAIVKTVGRVWAEIESAPGELADFWKLRLDTQDEGNTRYPQNNVRFFTPEQYSVKVREAAARDYLAAQGIRVDSDSPWRGRDVELADLLRKAEQ